MSNLNNMKMKSLPQQLSELEQYLEFHYHQLNILYGEIDCRIEHGAESNGHLEYVRNKLAQILKKQI